MSGESSSARPARLQRFGDTTTAMREALDTRIGLLEDALEAYRQSCEYDYRFVPTTTTPRALRSWAASLQELGEWTSAVGDGFMVANAVDLYVDGSGTRDLEGVFTQPTDVIAAHVDDTYDDPFLGVPEGGWQLDADRSIEVENPDALSDLLGNASFDLEVLGALLAGSEDFFEAIPRSATISVRVTATEILVLSNGSVVRSFTHAEARLRFQLPGRVPTGLSTATKWIGRTGTALSFTTAAYDQWMSDSGLNTGERVIRATTRAASITGFGLMGTAIGGFGAGAMTGTVCGPGAPICSGVLGFTGAFIGGVGFAIFGDKFASALPWMDDPPEPKPGEYDLDALRDEIAQEDSEFALDLSPLRSQTRTFANDLAMAETADNPELYNQVYSLTNPILDLTPFDPLTLLEDYIPETRHPNDLRPLVDDLQTASPRFPDGN